MPSALILHGGHAVTWSAWHLEPTVVAGAVFVCGAYLISLRNADRPLSWFRVACFYLGVAAMFLSLVSPLDAGADWLLSLHMLQHVALTTIGPPLVLLGLSQGQLAPLLQQPALARLARGLTNPIFAAALFLVNMWFWHVPSIYEAALNDLPVHIIMHIAFMTTGLIFWLPVVQPLPALARLGDGGRLLYLFVSGFPMGLLALLLLASGSAVYDYYETAPRLWGVSPLIDQQIAGVIMGALGEAASFVAITFLFFRFLDREEAAEAVPPPHPEAADAG
jgi:putative membrane protein